MHRQGSLALLLGLLPLALAASSLEVSSPLLVWSNRGHVGEGKGQTVSYQVVSNVASDLVLGAAGKGSATASGFASKVLNLASLKDSSSTVVVFLGSQLDAADLRHGSASQLSTVLESSASSFVLPYASSSEPLSAGGLSSVLSKAGLAYQTVSCDGAEGDLVDALSKAKDGAVQVVIVCSSVAGADDSTAAGLSAELSQVQQVQQALDEAALEHVFVYAAAPAVSADQPANRRRSLQAYTGFGPYTSCGTLCQVQVRWLEGMLAVLFLALASCAGLVCLYVLDTPTRFERPKEGQN